MRNKNQMISDLESVKVSPVRAAVASMLAAGVLLSALLLTGCGKDKLPEDDPDYVPRVPSNSSAESNAALPGALEFALATDRRGYVVTGAGTYNGTELVIPETYLGLPVVGIANGAFRYIRTSASGQNFSAMLERVVLPAGVTVIGDYAFSDCHALKEVVFSSGGQLVEIGANAFAGCWGLKEMEIPAGVKRIGDNAFANCTGLTSFKLSNTVINLGVGVIGGCSSIERLSVAANNPVYHSVDNCVVDSYSKILVMGCRTSVIPSDGSVETIGDSAFLNCKGLTALHLPMAVTSVEIFAFAGCSDLESITADPRNQVYTASGNCLVERKTSVVVLGCKNSVIPAGTREIGDAAFYGCTGLANLTLPEGLRVIRARAFTNCTSLSRAVFPESLEEIGSFGFYGSGLTYVYLPKSVVRLGMLVFSNIRDLSGVDAEAASAPSGWNSSWDEDCSAPITFGVSAPQPDKARE